MASGGLPFIGHTIPFLRDASQLCFKMKKRYGPIYALNIAGTTFNIVTDVVHGNYINTTRLPLSTVSNVWLAFLIIGLNFFFKNEKTFNADYFHRKFNKDVSLWSPEFNDQEELREELRLISSK